MIDNEIKKIAEKYSLFKSLSIDNLNMNENWELNHMLTSHAYEFSPQTFANNKQWLKYFTDLEKISLNSDPENITKRLQLIYQFNFHKHKELGHTALYKFQTLNEMNSDIQEKIKAIKAKIADFSHSIQNKNINEDDAEKMTDYLDDMQLLQQLNSIELDESLYYLLIYRIDYKSFINHQHKTNL